MFGLSERTLLRDGRLIPSALVLSHPEQRERLRRNLETALDSTVVAGDPTFDRILDGRAWRGEYRHALDVGGRALVLVTSTWGPGSLLGGRPELLPALLRELPVDEYRVAFAAHPNTWHTHGMWQVRTWLAECERAGLAVLPPRAGWQAALVAADHVIGDHGSVTFYGAALGTHTMLATFPHEELDPASPVAEFGRNARTLVHGRPLADQLAEDAAHHTPARFTAATDRLTSMPGASGPTLRTLCYDLMGLAEPATRVRTTPPEPPEPQPLTWPARAPVGPLLVTANGDASEVRVTRYPAELAIDSDLPLDRPHLVVDAAEPDSTWHGRADVLVRRHAGGAASHTWIAETLRTHPACRIAAVPTEGACLVGTRNGSVFELTREGEAGIPPDALVSAFWRAHAQRDLGSGESVKVTLGTRRAVLRITRVLE
ncbi:hypothetical protein [Halostreptopolyspora alba]|uniref:PAS domain-containing protein n=1 Tax=Halostreptopolyspora alba TaxID=2487137 RepID=A0A3N0E6L2_9ACTN|nr:hypothetical protein EFW17_15790 [Nocardiopsaceae bacterium YIM 96095]